MSSFIFILFQQFPAQIGRFSSAVTFSLFVTLIFRKIFERETAQVNSSHRCALGVRPERVKESMVTQSYPELGSTS